MLVRWEADGEVVPSEGMESGLEISLFVMIGLEFKKRDRLLYCIIAHSSW